MKNRLQIGVMGSAADLKYSKKLEVLAFDTGRLIAESGNILIYGAEKDYSSLSTVACRGAKSVGGVTVGITYGKGKKIWDKENTDIIIPTGIERGGGREFVLINSCDAIIVIAGGSGTLTEMAMAYQANIPIVVLEKTGGWADQLANKYIDARKRVKIIVAKTAKEAVKAAISI